MAVRAWLDTDVGTVGATQKMRCDLRLTTTATCGFRPPEG